MDTDESGQLDFTEFKNALDNFKLVMNEAEQEKLFKIFDKSGDGLISFNEFLTAIVGDINANRKRLVAEAFKKLDDNGNGTLELGEVKSKFDPSRHPDVI